MGRKIEAVLEDEHDCGCGTRVAYQWRERGTVRVLVEIGNPYDPEEHTPGRCFWNTANRDGVLHDATLDSPTTRQARARRNADARRRRPGRRDR